MFRGNNVACHLYQTFGLQIRSELCLPELVTSNSSAIADGDDVVIRHATEQDAIPPADAFPSNDRETARRPFLRAPAGDIYLSWPAVGRARVSGGRLIAFQPDPGVPAELLRLHLLGSALGVTLHQRGLLPLHASVVALHGGAIAFLGSWGAGKSTTAAAMHVHGYPLLADDIAALDLAPDLPYARIGFPQMKLWPESLPIFGDSPDRLPLVHPAEEKRIKTIEPGDACTPLPLQCIYLLQDGPQVQIAPIAPKEALFDLLANWYGARFGQGFLDTAGQQRLFAHVVRVTKTVPIFTLQRPLAIAQLPTLVQQVAAHAVGLVHAN